MEFGSVTHVRSNKLSETVVVGLLIDLVTLEKERKESSIVVVVAGNSEFLIYSAKGSTVNMSKTMVHRHCCCFAVIG